jgi:hypothetical protein
VLKQDVQLYTIGELCDVLNKKGYTHFHLQDIKYLAKVLNKVLGITSNELLSRLYTESDLDMLVTFLGSKDQELNQGSARSMPVKTQVSENVSKANEYAEEVTSVVPVVHEKSIVTNDPSIENLKEFMVEIVSNSLQSTLIPELHDLKKDLMDLKIQNIALKTTLERQQEEHYRQIDLKLSQWREKSFNRSTPWYKKLFR